jgi:hypothetical protein
MELGALMIHAVGLFVGRLVVLFVVCVGCLTCGAALNGLVAGMTQ